MVHYVAYVFPPPWLFLHWSKSSCSDVMMYKNRGAFAVTNQKKTMRVDMSNWTNYNNFWNNRDGYLSVYPLSVSCPSNAWLRRKLQVEGSPFGLCYLGHTSTTIQGVVPCLALELPPPPPPSQPCLSPFWGPLYLSSYHHHHPKTWSSHSYSGRWHPSTVNDPPLE